MVTWPYTPVREESNLDWRKLSEHESRQLKRSYIDGHLETIKRADFVLIANYPKNGIEGYIGANALMEAAFAYALGVPVAYMQPVGAQPCQLEALALSEYVIGDDLNVVQAILAKQTSSNDT